MTDPSAYSRADPVRLAVILALVTALSIAIVYVLLPQDPTNRYAELFFAAAPSAVVVLLGLPVAYFLLRPSSRYGRARADAVADRVVERLPDVARLPQVIDFKDTFRQIDWESVIGHATNSFDIVVYYFDSWTRNNIESIRTFFDRKTSSMRIVMADLDVPENMAMITRLFPEYDEATLRTKVERTGRRLAQALSESGGPASRLQVYYCSHPLPYSAQCLDGKVLIMSVFEAYRKGQIDSPAILIDLERSEHLARYWSKEIDGLIADSHAVRPIPLNA